jgi:hypothetical protein
MIFALHNSIQKSIATKNIISGKSVYFVNCLDHLKIQTNTPINNATATQVARNPSTLSRLGFVISKSG